MVYCSNGVDSKRRQLRTVPLELLPKWHEAIHRRRPIIVKNVERLRGNSPDEFAYWSWYGFDSRVEWCACFVSWCADQCGCIESGVIPKFSACVDGVRWFRSNSQWQDRNYEPQAGDIIFFDWDGDGTSDHVGIVERCENGVVYTVGGNSGDACRGRQYSVGSGSILGYGVPIY